MTDEKENMKGNNVLILNPATMMEALQTWLDANMPGAATKVTCVEQLTDVGPWGGQFQIQVTNGE